MKHNYFYFRSFQVAVFILMIFVIGGCSVYSEIEQKRSITPPSTIYTQLVASELLSLQETIDTNPVQGSATEHALEQWVVEAEKVEFLEMVVEQRKQYSEDNQSALEMNEEIQHAMKIAITFDDGPDLKYTPQILDILKEYNIPATFFVVGIQIKKYPEVLQRIEAEGHLIANHSYVHPNFTDLSKDKLFEEIHNTDQLIIDTIGYVPSSLVRPPYGALNDEVRAQLKAMGKQVVLWNIDPRDWNGTPVKEMLANILDNARDGSNILLHSFGNKHVGNTIELLPLVIDALVDQGYRFVTVDQL